MKGGRQTRRHFLKATGVVGTSSLLAGCSALDSLLGGGESLEGGLGRVPGSADMAVSLDAQTVLTDEAVHPLVGQYLAARADRTSDDGPRTQQAALDRFESRTGLDTSAVSSLVGFSNYDETGPVGSYRGCLFAAD
jgi:hypothetical protein